MKIRIFQAAALVLTFGLAVFGADVTGKWTGEMQGRNGPRAVTFNLTADGSTLKGNMLGMQGREMPISEGKIQGDEISFLVVAEFNGNTMKTTYNGKVSGDEIKMKSQREGADRTNEFTLKRAQ